MYVRTRLRVCVSMVPYHWYGTWYSLVPWYVHVYNARTMVRTRVPMVLPVVEYLVHVYVLVLNQLY
jgi:hypothetical protein